MNLLRSLPQESILVGVKAANKWELLERMLDHLMENRLDPDFEALNRAQIWELLRQREERQSTGVGEGFALPHVRLTPFKRLVMCLAILDEDLEFDAIDEKPVRLVCLVLFNAAEPGLALKVLSKWSGLVSSAENRERMLSARTSGEVHRFFASQDLEVEVVVHAEDLMVPPPFATYPDMDISQVTLRMMKHREPAVAVQERDGTLVGEIRSGLLFQYGMPDFFKQLQSVSFVKNFNPLEKYFENEFTAKAFDLMSTDYAEVDRKSTLVEIIFLLTVKKYPNVYVTEDGKLVGVISRLAVLDRAINF